MINFVQIQDRTASKIRISQDLIWKIIHRSFNFYSEADHIVSSNKKANAWDAIQAF